MTIRNRIQAGDGDPRHGTTNGYCGHGCRCPGCREAWRIYCLEYAHRTGRSRPAAEVRREQHAAVQHGSYTMYVKRKCRCDECRAWSRRNRDRYRQAARARGIPAHVHGTDGGYTNWACRCDACRAARSRANGVRGR